MLATDEEVFVFEKEEFEIPCDASGAEGWPSTPGPAVWAAKHLCPACYYTHTFLLCDDCREYIMEYVGPNSCHCGHVENRLSKFFTSFTAI